FQSPALPWLHRHSENTMDVTKFIEAPGPARPQRVTERPAADESLDARHRPGGDEPALAAPVESVPAEGVAGLIELILKNRSLLHRLIRDPWLQADLIPRFLMIALAGFVLYGVA